MFSKLLGIEHVGQSGQAIICVTNRQKPTTICVYPILSRQFKFCLGLAVAHYRDEVVGFFAKEKRHLAELDASRPLPVPKRFQLVMSARALAPPILIPA